MKAFKHFIQSMIVLLFVFIILSEQVFSQSYNLGRTVIVNGATSNLSSRDYSTNLVIGEPFIISTKGLTNSLSTGLWGEQLSTPSSPFVSASEGDFSDKVEISWKLDILSPAPNKGYHIFRDGVLLARVNRKDTSYVDRNVKAGDFYFYTITAINEYGESVLGSTTGFINPNGVITGTITTSKKRPVSDVEVNLTPVIGRSLSFDGTDDRILYSNVSSLTSAIDTALTISMWVNAASTGTDRMLGGGQLEDGSGISYPFTLFSNAGKFAATITTSSGSETLVGSTTLNDSEWYQVALSYSPSNGAHLLLNGSVEATSSANSGSIVGFSSLLIGEDIDDSGSGLASWDGLIDEIRLWNIYRDSSTIQNDKDRTISGRSEGLVGYWRLDEGTGDLVFDLTQQKTKGNIEGASFSTEHASLPASAITDSLGNYRIEGVFYGSSTTFDVTPVKALHSFQPALRNATLSTSNTGVNSINFEDDSQLAVEGFIKFQGTECFVDSVEILVDGKSTIPKTYTNSDGGYVVEFQPNTTATIGPKKFDHAFSPINYVVENINEPIAGIEFIDNELVDLTINFVGGACKFPLGKASVIVRTEDGCFNKEFDTNNAGFAVLRNIPANKYEVILKPEDPNITFDGVQVDLSAGSDTVEFIYRAPLEADIKLISSARRVNNIPVLKMAAEGQDTTDFRFDVFERYGNNICYIDTGKVKITDNIALRPGSSALTFSNPDKARPDSMPVYSLIVGRPNFLDGGAHPYQKDLEIQVTDATGRNTVANLWAYIEGHKTVGDSFITKAPNRPLFILRDPPGDKSYSEITKEYTLSYSSKVKVKQTEKNEFESTEVGGVDEIEGEGILIETIEENLESNQTSSTTTVGVGLADKKTISFKEVFRTDENASSADGRHDIIAGAGENYLYGIVRRLRINSDGTVDIDEKLGIESKGFHTFYYYTVQYIEDVLIPSLEASDLESDEKSDEINRWNRHLDFHNQLTGQNFAGLLNLPQNLPQLLFKQNVSFSAGAPYEAESEYKAVTGVEWSDEIEIETEVADALIISVSGSGERAKTEVSYEYVESTESGIEYEGSTATKIVLDDETEGDAYSVDIETDVLGFPLYKIKGGQSTNPWQEGTSKRDNVSLTMDSYDAVNVPPTGRAEFTINIGNTSETDEERIYEIRLIPESNPDGAILKIGGKTLPATNSFTIPAGETVQAELTVERGPDAFEYDSLLLMAYAPGQYDLWLETENEEFLNAVDTVAVNVQFSRACGSDVAIANFNNFIINQFDSTAFPVQVFGYNPNDPDFDQLLLEYQHSNEDFWIIADSVRTDSIGLQPFYFMNWAFQDLLDGNYKLRVKSVCLDGTVSESNVIEGIMDRSNPSVLGETSPVNNGSLGFNQDIAITFTEDIDTTTLFIDRIRLINAEEGIEIPMKYTSDGRTLVLTPELQNRFIEGVRLRAEVDTLADLHGNWITEPIVWEFEVDRNPIRWNQAQLTEAVIIGNESEFTIPVRNVSQATTNFTVTDIPQWLSVDPIEGDIGANGQIDIELQINEEINFGSYLDTLNINTSEGDEPLRLSIRALNEPPTWDVNPLDFEYQMSMIGQVVLRDTVSRDPYDIIGIFKGNECRGFATPVYVEETDTYLFFLNIYSNEERDEELYIRLWDAQDSEEYWEINQVFSFNSGQVLGSVSQPRRIQAEGNIAQHIQLNKGWTWFTEHLQNTDENLNVNAVLNGLSFTEGDRIVSQRGFESWSDINQRWVPGRMVFRPTDSYQIYSDSAKSITFVGTETNPSSLEFEITQGNNWIGYPVREFIELNTALSNLNAAGGSVIRDQLSFSEFVADGLNTWIGSLNIMQPGGGYILKSTSNDTLRFTYQNTTLQKTKGSTAKSENKISGSIIPVVNGQLSLEMNTQIQSHSIDLVTNELKVSGSQQPLEIKLTPDNMNWSVDVYTEAYQMTAILSIDEAIADSNWFVGAMIDKKMIGLAQFRYVQSISEHRAFLMLYNDEAVETITSLLLLNKETGEVITLKAPFSFNNNQHEGLVLEPVELSLENDSEIPEQFSLSQNYPNPFNPSTTFEFSLPVRSDVSLVIYNSIGQKVATLINEQLTAGIHKVSWNAGSAGLASGMYLARFEAGNYQQIRKLLLIK